MPAARWTARRCPPRSLPCRRARLPARPRKSRWPPPLPTFSGCPNSLAWKTTSSCWAAIPCWPPGWRHGCATRAVSNSRWAPSSSTRKWAGWPPGSSACNAARPMPPRPASDRSSGCGAICRPQTPSALPRDRRQPPPTLPPPHREAPHRSSSASTPRAAWLGATGCWHGGFQATARWSACNPQP